MVSSEVVVGCLITIIVDQFPSTSLDDISFLHRHMERKIVAKEVHPWLLGTLMDFNCSLGQSVL